MCLIWKYTTKLCAKKKTWYFQYDILLSIMKVRSELVYFSVTSFSNAKQLEKNV